MSHQAIRIGQGWDVHALVPGRRLVIGGVHIPYHLGLLGHSDADVLVHAVIDAMLGAAALGDIGTHFPDTDERWKNADSLKLLSACASLLKDKGWFLQNLDSTVIAQAPKLAPFILAMREKIAVALAIDISNVNIKAKTAEKLGPVGQGQSVEAQAIVLLCSAG
jgi:2-C-methyl-D-erythritol 2,4-cyclodiphosphate synthase